MSEFVKDRCETIRDLAGLVDAHGDIGIASVEKFENEIAISSCLEGRVMLLESHNAESSLDTIGR